MPLLPACYRDRNLTEVAFQAACACEMDKRTENRTPVPVWNPPKRRCRTRGPQVCLPRSFCWGTAIFSPASPQTSGFLFCFVFNVMRTQVSLFSLESTMGCGRCSNAPAFPCSSCTFLLFQHEHDLQLCQRFPILLAVRSEMLPAGTNETDYERWLDVFQDMFCFSNNDNNKKDKLEGKFAFIPSPLLPV
uniref:Uncharacterized protein n=1 Tax=Molossus molossus TaxID=27622 RepID=A0A7J8CRY4_MOLMO|nr:hypothetical protein HJG59_009810 [Molossus molossus]